MAEHLVAPGVVERFNSLVYHFDAIADRELKIFDEKRNLKTEIDILLENGDYIIAVEVKADVRKNDIEHKEMALENGFYVLEQSGGTLKMDIPEGFKPKEW